MTGSRSWRAWPEPFCVDMLLSMQFSFAFLRWLRSVTVIGAMVLSPSLFAESSPRGTEIEFSSAQTYFHAKLTDKIFNFKDRTGSKSLEIKPCNKIIIEKTWSALLNQAKNLTPLDRTNARPKLARGNLKFENIDFVVMETEPALSFLNHFPQRFTVLFIESLRQCKNK